MDNIMHMHRNRVKDDIFLANSIIESPATSYLQMSPGRAEIFLGVA